jgi:hypothetical protein
MRRLARIVLVSACSATALSRGGIVALGLLLAGTACAQGIGRSLDIQPGARQNGMGAAGVALLGDPSEAVWWNPAVLGFADKVSAQLTYSELVPGLPNADVRYYHGAGAFPLRAFGGIGLGFTRLSYGEQDFGTGPFTSNEISPAASVGMRVSPRLSVGATLKWVRIQIAPKSLSGEATTFGFDLGALYRVPTKPLGLSLGLNIQNLGPSAHFPNEDKADPLGRNAKVGVAVNLPVSLADGFETGGTAVLDFNQSLVTNDFHTVNGGVEGYLDYSSLVRLAFRGGYYSDPLGDIHDETFGFGARILGLTMDAAWIPQARELDQRVLKLTGGFHLDLFRTEADRASR